MMKHSFTDGSKRWSFACICHSLHETDRLKLNNAQSGETLSSACFSLGPAICLPISYGLPAHLVRPGFSGG